MSLYINARNIFYRTKIVRLVKQEKKITATYPQIEPYLE